MDTYQFEYVRHELPLVALSGLGENPKSSSGEPLVSSTLAPGASIPRELPEVSPQFARALQDGFYRADGSALPWDGSTNPQKPGLFGFNFLSVGTKFVFPRRKAAPAAQTPSEELATPPIASHSVVTELHSTLSPLSPTSPLFPDGLVNPLWLSKHQRNVPAVLLCFYELDGSSLVATSQDDQLRHEVTRIKLALSRSGYKTRLAVAVLCEKNSSDVEDRISNLRRATGLDRSTFFVLLDPQTQSDINYFILDTLSTLQTTCIDYYRDLTKHSRRKKNRGYIPAPTASALKGAQPLPLSGWNARYDFKQGIFAEFRQEMDAAERHYSAALDELYSDEGVLEFTSIKSPRWEEARRLADTIALRVLRCLLWRSLTSAAAEFWSAHRMRTHALVGRRGDQQHIDALSAWDTTWAQLMSELIVRANVPAFDVKGPQPSADSDQLDQFVVINVSAPPEKGYTSTDKVLPFHILHHAGYWYRMAQQWAIGRYRKADNSSLEKQATDTAISAIGEADKSIETQILELSEAAEAEFTLRRQFRMSSQLALQRARILSNSGMHDKAMHALLAVWADMKWRSEGWWDLAGEVLLALFEAAILLGEQRVAIEVKWEMLSNVFGHTFSKRLEEPATNNGQSEQGSLDMDSAERLAPITVSFCFTYDEGHVGDTMGCQVALQYPSVAAAAAMQLKSVDISISSGTHISISHDRSLQPNAFQGLILKETPATDSHSSRTLTGPANLDYEPNAVRVLTFGLPLRTAGEIEVVQAKVEAVLDGFVIRQTLQAPSLNTTTWRLNEDGCLQTRSLDRSHSIGLEVLPKPPRLQLRLSESSLQYFTGEEVTVGLLLINEETAPVQGSVETHAPAETLELLNPRWNGANDDTNDAPYVLKLSDPVPPSAEQRFDLSFRTPADPTSLTLSFNVSYTIGNDTDTVVTTTASFNFDFIRPLDIEFELVPRLDEEEWPNFFSLPEVSSDSDKAQGIRQQWLLSAHISSPAETALSIEKAALAVANAAENVICHIPHSFGSDAPISVGGKASHVVALPFFTQRRSLDDRRPSPVSFELQVSWKREGSPKASAATAIIPVPTFQMPAAEPRVLCTSTSLTLETQGHALASMPCGRMVTYTIENPSMHFLTFSLAMEASDQFAFSGPKLRNVSLTPLSRRSVEYRLVLLDTSAPEKFGGRGEAGNALIKGAKGKWIFPALQVTDSYFNKSLRVSPAGHGVDYPKTELSEASIGVWVPVDSQ